MTMINRSQRPSYIKTFGFFTFCLPTFSDVSEIFGLKKNHLFDKYYRS